MISFARAIWAKAVGCTPSSEKYCPNGAVALAMFNPAMRLHLSILAAAFQTAKERGA
jgi:hypothetical protein